MKDGRSTLITALQAARPSVKGLCSEQYRVILGLNWCWRSSDTHLSIFSVGADIRCTRQLFSRKLQVGENVQTKQTYAQAGSGSLTEM